MSVCVGENCGKPAKYNFPREKLAVYCAKCKSKGMVPIPRKCAGNGCYTTASFNYPGEKTKLYCASCRLEGMVGWLSTCNTATCTKIPSFGFSRNEKPLYCNSCKTEGMVNVRNKVCKTLNCNKLARYNFQGLDVLYCLSCRVTGMIQKPTLGSCIIESCNNKGKLFNYPHQKRGLYCFACKAEGMVWFKKTKTKRRELKNNEVQSNGRGTI
eukprot:Pgem_evm1s11873